MTTVATTSEIHKYHQDILVLLQLDIA